MTDTTPSSGPVPRLKSYWPGAAAYILEQLEQRPFTNNQLIPVLEAFFGTFSTYTETLMFLTGKALPTDLRVAFNGHHREARRLTAFVTDIYNATQNQRDERILEDLEFNELTPLGETGCQTISRTAQHSLVAFALAAERGDTTGTRLIVEQYVRGTAERLRKIVYGVTPP